MDRQRRQAPHESLPHNAGSAEAAGKRTPPGPKKKSPPSGNVGQLARAWEAQATNSNIKAVLRDLEAHAGNLAPNQISPFLIGAIVARWRKRYKLSTAYQHRHVLVKLLRNLEPFGAPRIDVPKVPRPQPRATVATAKELAALLQSPAPHLRLFMLLYIQAGLRYSEALRVTPATYNKEKATATITVKGGRQRTLYLTPDITRILDSVDPDPGTPYIWALRGRIQTSAALRKAWTRHKLECGLNPTLTAHDLRRSAATILYAQTHDLRHAQELLGHKSLTSTLTYLAPLHPDDARKYAELLRFEHFKSETKQ